MIKYEVRYGNSYKIVLAIVLPSLFTIYPFILLMQFFPNLNDIEMYIVIYLFLGLLIAITLWLVLNIYPKAILGIGENEISITFFKKNLLSPNDFTVKSSQIKQIMSKTTPDYKGLKSSRYIKFEWKGDNYLLFETTIHPHKFQLSAASYSDEESLDDAYTEINDMIYRQTTRID